MIANNNSQWGREQNWLTDLWDELMFLHLFAIITEGKVELLLNIRIIIQLFAPSQKLHPNTAVRRELVLLPIIACLIIPDSNNLIDKKLCIAV